MKWIGTIILAAGLLLTGWSGYQWYLGKQSVSELATSQTVSANSDKQHIHKEKRDVAQTNNLHKAPTKKINTLDFNYKKGEQMASLQIPSIGKQFDVFWGADEQSLKRGVGMYVSKWTTVPNIERGHTVLSGHRETVFTELGDVKEGDILTVHFDGQNYDYEVDKTWVTDAEDRSVIVEKEEATLTLTTCYPFEFLGDAPDRYIIQAHLKE